MCTIVLLSARRWTLGVVAGCAATCTPRSQVATLVQTPYVLLKIGSTGIFYQRGAPYCYGDSHETLENLHTLELYQRDM